MFYAPPLVIMPPFGSIYSLGVCVCVCICVSVGMRGNGREYSVCRINIDTNHARVQLIGASVMGAVLCLTAH